MSQHTLALYRHFYENLPPLFPEELSELMKYSLEKFEQADEVGLEEIEKEMVKFGFHVWPFRQAHQEFVDKAIDKMGDHFLLPHLDDKELQQKYQDLRDYGASWHDIYHGRPAEMFDSEQRVDLTEALVLAKQKLHDFVKQEILGLGREKYLGRVEKYTGTLEEIKKELDELKVVAEETEDHPLVVDHIKEKIKDVEHSLCLLGQELKYHEIKNAKEFFEGRKEELQRLRGIHEPKKIDFYNEK